MNNAGIGFVGAIEDTDEERLRLLWETNFWGPVRLCRAVLPHMRARGNGVIVNLSSFGARFPGGAWLAMYGAFKHGISRISESLNAELAGTGVRAVAMEPGFFATEIYAEDKRATIDPSSFYAPTLTAVDGVIAEAIAGGADPSAVAATVLAAVDDPDTPSCVLVGDDAHALGRSPTGPDGQVAGRVGGGLTGMGSGDKGRGAGHPGFSRTGQTRGACPVLGNVLRALVAPQAYRAQCLAPDYRSFARAQRTALSNAAEIAGRQ